MQGDFGRQARLKAVKAVGAFAIEAKDMLEAAVPKIGLSFFSDWRLLPESRAA
jgi:hypothetical protein